MFLLVPFEAGVLAAGFAGFITFLYVCGLPALYHRDFDIPGAERATSDRFYLIVNAPAEQAARLRELLIGEGAVSIEEAA